jgi:hypothetical protein
LSASTALFALACLYLPGEVCSADVSTATMLCQGRFVVLMYPPLPCCKPLQGSKRQTKFASWCLWWVMVPLVGRGASDGSALCYVKAAPGDADS